MTSTSTSTPTSGAFVTVRGDRHSEVAHTLAEPVPQALSLFDQLGLWGNLGVSLLGFTGAIFVLQPGGAGTPELSLAAGLTAIVLGTVLGTLPVALAGLPGARTGAPGHGAAPRPVRGQALLPAHRAQHPPVRRLGDLRAGHDRDRGAHRGPGAAPVGVHPARRGDHRAAHHPAAGLHPDPAPLRDRRGHDRPGVPIHPACPAPAAPVHAGHLGNPGSGWPWTR